MQEHDELRPMKWDANAASVLHCDLVKGKDALREGKAAPANQGRFLEYVAGQYRPNKGSVKASLTNFLFVLIVMTSHWRIQGRQEEKYT